MSEVVGKVIDSGTNDEGFWFKLRLNDADYAVMKGKYCLICTKPLPHQYKSRTRIYCSRECYNISQRRCQAKIDPVSVYRLIIGDAPAVTTKGELLRATAKLTKAGYSLLEIADRLRRTSRTISRYRKSIKEGETNG